MEPVDDSQIRELIERSERIVQEANRLRQDIPQARKTPTPNVVAMSDRSALHHTLASMFVSEGEQRLKAQEALITRLSTAGINTRDAEAFLRLLRLSLDTMRNFERLTTYEYAGRRP